MLPHVVFDILSAPHVYLSRVSKSSTTGTKPTIRSFFEANQRVHSPEVSHCLSSSLSVVQILVYSDFIVGGCRCPSSGR